MVPAEIAMVNLHLRHDRPGIISILLMVVFAVSSIAAETRGLAPSPSVASNSERLLRHAATAEQAGQWSHALDLYLRAYTQFGPSPEMKERIRICLRNATNFSRHRDPAFQQYLVSLTISDALNVYAEVVEKLSTLYADRDRALPERLFALGVDELDRSLADADFRHRYLNNPDPAKIQRFQQSLRELWKARLPQSHRETRHAARQLVLAAQAQIQARNGSAIILELLCGACSGLDEYSTFTPPVTVTNGNPSPNTDLSDYGILIKSEMHGLTIDTLLPNSWATDRTPLQPSDRLLRLNGVDLQSHRADAWSAAWQRASASSHQLEVETANGETVTVRLPIPCPTVIHTDIVKEDIGIIRLAAFRESTVREFDDAVLSLRARGMKVLILDLRGNPGGLVAPGVGLCERLIASGIVLTTRGQMTEFSNRIFTSDAGMAAYDFPMVVLIDGRTMSAAEMVALALKENSRATLVGTTTFGKGAMQAPIPLQHGQGTTGKPAVLILTVAGMYGPNGTPIASGVTPHLLESDPARQLTIAIARALELVPEMQ
ncbi:MAG: hypothetical protein LC104_15285 [Bacteroidales bacterium]|nr:hypothetical protein [Bacteroidales bacterium]